jgi:multiple sugar transport system permease protein
MARQEEREGWLFASPWLIGTAIFLVGPVIASLVISLTDWNLISSPRFVGLDNYAEMLDSRAFWQSVRVTLAYVVLGLPLFQVAGLALALLLNLRLRGMYLFRTILFLPSVLSGVAVAVLWLQLLNPADGVVNQMLRAVGVSDPPGWLSSPTWAVPAVVLMGLWGVGGGAIIYLAGLQNIPPHLYEAARIDGAGTWRSFRHVTLPMLTPTLLFTLLIGIIGAFQVFDIAYVLGGSRGGTRGSLLFYLLNLWNEGFRSGRFGYASALAWVLVIVAAVVIVAILRTSDRWVHDESEGN